MKITSQSDVALRRRYMLSLYDLLPLSVADTVLSLKIDLTQCGRNRLVAVSVIVPNHKDGNQDKRHYTDNNQI
jgi:hypothetical protein